MQDRTLYFILGVCFVGFYFSHSWNGPSRGKPVDMNFTATDGSRVDLSAMRGKVVLVDFLGDMVRAVHARGAERGRNLQCAASPWI